MTSSYFFYGNVDGTVQRASVGDSSNLPERNFEPSHSWAISLSGDSADRIYAATESNPQKHVCPYWYLQNRPTCQVEHNSDPQKNCGERSHHIPSRFSIMIGEFHDIAHWASYQ